MGMLEKEVESVVAGGRGVLGFPVSPPHTPSPAGSLSSHGLTPCPASVTGSPVSGGSFGTLPAGFPSGGASAPDGGALEAVAGTDWTSGGGGAAPSGSFGDDVWAQAAILAAFIGTPMEDRIHAAMAGRIHAVELLEWERKERMEIERSRLPELLLDVRKEKAVEGTSGEQSAALLVLLREIGSAYQKAGEEEIRKKREAAAEVQDRNRKNGMARRALKGVPDALKCPPFFTEREWEPLTRRESVITGSKDTFVDNHLDPMDVYFLQNNIKAILALSNTKDMDEEFRTIIGLRMVESVMIPYTVEFLSVVLEEKKSNLVLSNVFRGVRPLQRSGELLCDSEIDAVLLFSDSETGESVQIIVSIKMSGGCGRQADELNHLSKIVRNTEPDVGVLCSMHGELFDDKKMRCTIGTAEYEVTPAMSPVRSRLGMRLGADPASLTKRIKMVLGQCGSPTLGDIIMSLSRYRELREDMVKLLTNIPALFPAGVGSLPETSRSVDAEMAVYGPVTYRVPGTPQMQMAHFLMGVRCLISQLESTKRHPHLLAMLKDKLKFTLSFDHLLKLEGEQIEAETRKIEEAKAGLEDIIRRGTSREGKDETSLFDFAGGDASEGALLALRARREQLKELCASAALVTPLPLSAHSPGADVPVAESPVLPDGAVGGSVVTSRIASLRAMLSTIPTTGAAGAPPRSPSPVDHDVASADDGSVRLSVDQFLSADRLFALDFGRPAGKPVKLRLFDLSTGGGALADTPAVAAASAVDWGAPPPPFLHLCTLSVGGGLDEREESYAAPTAVAELPVLPDGAAGGAFAALAECARREKGELALQEELYPPVAPPPPSSPRSPSPS